MKKKFSLLLVLVILLGALSLPALAAKPGDEVSFTIPFSHANLLFSIQVNYSLSSGLSLVSVTSAEMSMTAGAASAIGFTLTGVKSGNIVLKVKVLDTAAAKETVSITKVEGAWGGNPGDKGAIGTPIVHTIDVELPPALDEWGEWVVTVEPTCLVTGIRTRVHKTDPTQKETETIPALGHDWSIWIESIPATCLTDGEKERVCKRDATHTEAEDIKALGHDWGEWVEITPATCLTDGMAEMVCKRDSTHAETEIIPALGHDWGEWVEITPATCLADGMAEMVCKRDSTHAETELLPALGHDAGKWVITKKPARTEEGARELRCTRDGALLKTEIMPMVTTVFYPNNTMCIMGLRLRDIAPDATKQWYMVTPLDISQDGEQTFPLVASNLYKVGTATITVQEGQLTVTCETLKGVTVHSEYLAIYPDLETAVEQDAAGLGGESLKLGEPISIADTLSGDTSVLLLLVSQVSYDSDVKGLYRFSPYIPENKDALEQMRQMIP